MKIVIEVRNLLNSGNYFIEAQYCHPERVTDKALEIAEETAQEVLDNITDEEIENCIKIHGDDLLPNQILQILADEKSEKSGFETITTCIFVKK